METFTHNHNKSNGRILAGLLLLAIGFVFILRNFGVNIPSWILSWHTIMLVIGLAIGYKRNFRPGLWVVFVAIGGIYTLKDIVFFNFDLSPYIGAVLLISLGLYLILKPKRTHRFCEYRKNKDYVPFEDLTDKNDSDTTDQKNK